MITSPAGDRTADVQTGQYPVQGDDGSGPHALISYKTALDRHGLQCSLTADFTTVRTRAAADRPKDRNTTNVSPCEDSPAVFTIASRDRPRDGNARNGTIVGPHCAGRLARASHKAAADLDGTNVAQAPNLAAELIGPADD